MDRWWMNEWMDEWTHMHSGTLLLSTKFCLSMYSLRKLPSSALNILITYMASPQHLLPELESVL